jgi:psiF repeat
MRASTWLTAMSAVLAFVTAQAALAQTAAPAQSTQLNSQQEKMKECNAEAKAKNVTGADRKTFMSSCLSSKGVSQEDINKQQQKMKTCNADAKSKGLAADDRKAFMKSCLSSSSG